MFIPIAKQGDRSRTAQAFMELLQLDGRDTCASGYYLAHCYLRALLPAPGNGYISKRSVTLSSHVVGYRGTALEPHHGGQALQRAGVCRTDGAGACLLWPHRSSVRSAQARASQTHKYDFLPVHAVHVAQETQRRHDLGVSVSECVRCSHCLARVPVSYVPTFSGTCAKPRLCSPGGLDTASLVR